MTVRQIDLFPYLIKKSDLVPDFKVAQIFSLPRDALLEILKARLGPEPMPAEASRKFWFLKQLLPCWQSWARTASDEDVGRVAEIIRRHDRALRIPEFAHLENDDARSFLISVFVRRRR
jgi:hypothetical protein